MFQAGHGTQTLKRAVENSCNVALMEIGQQMGVEDFVKYQKVFGFGEFCGIDLPGEAGGLSLVSFDMVFFIKTGVLFSVTFPFSS